MQRVKFYYTKVQFRNRIYYTHTISKRVTFASSFQRQRCNKNDVTKEYRIRSVIGMASKTCDDFRNEKEK